MQALVVNCSAPHYNLGAEKLSDWLREQGYTVETAAGDPGMFSLGYDLVALSVIFSWHAPRARAIALRVRAYSEVWCGGPGMYALSCQENNWWKQETDLTATSGLDMRFDRQQGKYSMTFATRGCPVGCWFCTVPKIEGKVFRQDRDFQPAPILCDNNWSALPVLWQEFIIQRYQESGVVLADANSGFEPRAFDEGTYARWRPILRGPWRFALDEQKERADVERMMRILAHESPGRKRVYVLIGNEPIESCWDRVLAVLAWGGEPFCQYGLPLNWLGDPATLPNRHDWTYQKGRDFCRYINGFCFRKFPITEYSSRLSESAPFAGTAIDTPAWRARWTAALADYRTFQHRTVPPRPDPPEGGLVEQYDFFAT